MRASLRAMVIAVCASGLIAGTLDLGAAALINQLSPVIILRAIASGLLGRASFTGGSYAALLGLLLQWAMSVVIAAIYFLATQALPLLRRHWWMGGLLAGLIIQLVMVYLVVPLSAAPFRMQLSLHDYFAHFHAVSFGENLMAMFVFGLVVAYGASTIPRAPAGHDSLMHSGPQADGLAE